MSNESDKLNLLDPFIESPTARTSLEALGFCREESGPELRFEVDPLPLPMWSDSERLALQMTRAEYGESMEARIERERKRSTQIRYTYTGPRAGFFYEKFCRRCAI